MIWYNWTIYHHLFYSDTNDHDLDFIFSFVRTVEYGKHQMKLRAKLWAPQKYYNNVLCYFGFSLSHVIHNSSTFLAFTAYYFMLIPQLFQLHFMLKASLIRILNPNTLCHIYALFNFGVTKGSDWFNCSVVYELINQSLF